jgi:type I restriction enzyme M protein
MNFAIRGIDSSNVKWNNEGSFLNDAHKDLKADYIIANPPFNDSDWSGELLQKDARWVYGLPPAGNANYAWIQHFLFHLSASGQAGFVLSKGALTTNNTGEGDIRKALIENDLLDCIVNLPTKLFLNTQIPACLWFLSKNKKKRKGQILFIDARNLGFLKSRKNREFTDEDISMIATTYHNWRTSDAEYNDMAGFCKSATTDEVRNLNYLVTPGRYIGLPDDEDDFNFAERFTSLKTELERQILEEEALNKRIAKNLSKINLNVNADVAGN